MRIKEDNIFAFNSRNSENADWEECFGFYLWSFEAGRWEKGQRLNGEEIILRLFINYKNIIYYIYFIQSNS